MKSRSNLLVISTTSWNVHPSSLSIPSVSISFPNNNTNITHHTHMYYYYTMLCVYAVYYVDYTCSPQLECPIIHDRRSL